MSTIQMTTAGLENNEFSINDSNLSNVNINSQGMSMKVTTYNYGNINPSPIKLPKDTELLEEFLSPRKLQALTGVDNLDTVEYLEMRVNTEQMSLGNFGMYLPNLTQIKLSGSYIPTIRDLGTSLWNLQVLWMPQCCLHCLDGLVTMANMKELYLAYNDIEDISSCGMLENLEILDLEGNHVDDCNNLHYLAMCPNLSRLTLEGNPLCSPTKYEPPMTYRRLVFESIPHLEYLDDISVDQFQTMASGDSGKSQNLSENNPNATMEFEEHWNFINSVLVESGLLAESARSKDTASPTSPDDSGRPSSSHTSSTRPSTSMRPMSAQRRTLSSAMGRPGTSSSQRPLTALSVESSNDGDDRTDDSGLTAGRVVCGNLTKSLRRHSDEQASNCPRLKLQESRPKTSFVPKIKEIIDSDVEESCEMVLKELSQWRQDYEKSKARIEKHKAPQVLTIDCSEDEIEEVDVTNNVSTDRQSSSHKYESHIPISHRSARKIKSDIKLNPIKNGKLNDGILPSSWIPQMKTNKSSTSSNSIVTANPSTNSDCSIKSAAPQMSRIRRQLLQGGVSTIAPSKPLLKR